MGGWVPDVIGWLVVSHAVPCHSSPWWTPRVSRPSLPLIRPVICTLHFFCDSLALQFETSELGSPWAGCLVSKRYSGDEYRVFSEILQTNQNNSYETECMKPLIGWVLKLEENCTPCAIQVTINNQDEIYKTIFRTVYCRYLIIVKIIIINW